MSQTEKTILSGLLANSDFCKKVIPFIAEEYFHDRIECAIFKAIKCFVDEYNGIPSKEAILISLEDEKSFSDEEFSNCKDIVDEISAETKQDTAWLTDLTEKFCKDKAVFNAILESIKIIDGKDITRSPNALPEILSNALAVSFDTDVGHDYLEDYEKRFDFYHRVEKRIAFDLEMFNTITQGGICSKTLNIFMAGTGVGKSAFMCHHAAACLLQNKNVLYITLEMAEERIAERIDANIMDISMDDLGNLSKEMYEKRLKLYTRGISGKLIVKEYPTSSANAGHFRVLMDELWLKKEFKPDIVFIDYINICCSSRFKSGNNNVNSYSYIKAIAEELRGLAMERDIPIISATQTNRQGFSSTDVDLTDTAESFGLPATADLMIALITTEELERAGHILVKQLKNRYNTKTTNKKFIVGLNYSKMKFYDVAHSEFDPLINANIKEDEDSGFGSGYGKKDFTAKFGSSKTADWTM